MTRIFLATWGQNDNIGDSILRRGLLRTFQELPDARLHVYLGRMDSSEVNDEQYVSALGLRGDEVLYDRRDMWLKTGFAGLLEERTILVQTSGELVYPPGLRWTSGWRTLLGVAIARMRGGSGIQVGAGVRLSSVGADASAAMRTQRTSTELPLLERLARRSMSYVAWRDQNSRDAFGIGEVRPDWAFAEGPDPLTAGLGRPASERTKLAVTMRWDREPLGDDKVELLRRIATDRGLEIQVYTQVRRDRESALELSQRFDTSLPPILFGEESHAEWEAVMRRMYSESAIVASDRAHALIIGATEGAVPLAVSSWTVEKATRMLRVGGFEMPADSAGEVESYLDDALGDPDFVDDRIVRAREQIAEVRTIVGRVVRHGRIS